MPVRATRHRPLVLSRRPLVLRQHPFIPSQHPFILSLSKDAREASPVRGLRQAQPERGSAGGETI